MGEEGNSSGSDSEPSADNLDDDELAKITPVKIIKKPEIKKKEIKPPMPKKLEKPLVKKPQSPMQKRPLALNEVSKSPAKRMGNNNTFDRLSIRKRKPEMIDAWTQTTPKSKE